MKLTRILKSGVTGEDVKFLQERLTKLGFYNAGITSNFGPKTELSVKALQENKGLPADGVVGMVTWAIISSEDTAPKPEVIEASIPEAVVDTQQATPANHEQVKPSGVITLQRIKNTVLSLGYHWFEDQPNLIGLRSNLDLPDIFNDFMFLIYKDDSGTEVMKTYQITTDPGVYWLNNPMNINGTAVLKPGQYMKSHSIGFHQNKKDHRALVQTGKLSVYRDKDKDSLAEATDFIDTGLFGVNLHGANKATKTGKIGKYSAGCQVFQNWIEKEEFIDIVENFKDMNDNKFTYTLLKENQII